MRKQYGVVLYRLSFGLLGLTAVIVQFVHSSELATFKASNFFSFFTIESNILAALIFLAAGAAGLAGKEAKQGSRLAILRGAGTFYMATTGIIYFLLLSGLEVSLQTTVPWVNAVLHYIMPMAVVADWLVNRPKRRIVFREAALWLIFPLVYLSYSLVRGTFVDWYPYPFLDPRLEGYGQVAFISTMIALALVGLTWFLAWSSRWRRA